MASSTYCVEATTNSTNFHLKRQSPIEHLQVLRNPTTYNSCGSPYLSPALGNASDAWIRHRANQFKKKSLSERNLTFAQKFWKEKSTVPKSHREINKKIRELKEELSKMESENRSWVLDITNVNKEIERLREEFEEAHEEEKVDITARLEDLMQLEGRSLKEYEGLTEAVNAGSSTYWPTEYNSDEHSSDEDSGDEDDVCDKQYQCADNRNELFTIEEEDEDDDASDDEDHHLYSFPLHNTSSSTNLTGKNQIDNHDTNSMAAVNLNEDVIAKMLTPDTFDWGDESEDDIEEITTTVMRQSDIAEEMMFEAEDKFANMVEEIYDAMMYDLKSFRETCLMHQRVKPEQLKQLQQPVSLDAYNKCTWKVHPLAMSKKNLNPPLDGIPTIRLTTPGGQLCELEENMQCFDGLGWTKYFHNRHYDSLDIREQLKSMETFEDRCARMEAEAYWNKIKTENCVREMNEGIARLKAEQEEAARLAEEQDMGALDSEAAEYDSEHETENSEMEESSQSDSEDTESEEDSEMENSGMTSDTTLDEVLDPGPQLPQSPQPTQPAKLITNTPLSADEPFFSVSLEDKSDEPALSISPIFVCYSLPPEDSTIHDIPCEQNKSTQSSISFILDLYSDSPLDDVQQIELNTEASRQMQVTSTSTEANQQPQVTSANSKDRESIDEDLFDATPKTQPSKPAYRTAVAELRKYQTLLATKVQQITRWARQKQATEEKEEQDAKLEALREYHTNSALKTGKSLVLLDLRARLEDEMTPQMKNNSMFYTNENNNGKGLAEIRFAEPLQEFLRSDSWIITEAPLYVQNNSNYWIEKAKNPYAKVVKKMKTVNWEEIHYRSNSDEYREMRDFVRNEAMDKQEASEEAIDFIVSDATWEACYDIDVRDEAASGKEEEELIDKDTIEWERRISKSKWMNQKEEHGDFVKREYQCRLGTYRGPLKWEGMSLLWKESGVVEKTEVVEEELD